MTKTRWHGPAVLVACAIALAACSSSSSSGGSTGTAPAAPSGVVATPGSAQVSISWTAVSGATSYNIYWSTTAGAGRSGTKITGASSPYVQTGLTNGTTYYYVVTAANASGESAASSQVSAVPSATPAPASPTGVQAIAGDAQVSVSWTAVSGATSYNVYWSTTAGAGVSGTKITGASSPYVQTGLTNGTTYYYVVTAANANGESTPSAQVSATPAAVPYMAALVLTLEGGGTPPFGFLEQATVCTDSTCSTPITNATVTVNGTALAWDATRQQYDGTQAIAAGAAVTVHVTVGSTTYTASGTQFSAAPTISAPVASAAWDAATANTIAWSGGSPTGGAAYVVGVLDANGDFVYPASGGGNNGPSELPLSTTHAIVPASTLAAGSDQVLVAIGTAGIVNQTSGGIAFNNGAAAGSGLWLGCLAPLVPVTVQGAASPPSAPTGVLATAGDGSVIVTWAAVAGATSYNVYWSTTSGAGVAGTKVAGVSSPYFQTGLANGTTYYFVVTAVNANGESAPSSEASATPSVGPPWMSALVLSLEGGGVPPFGFLQQVQVCTDGTCSSPISTATVTVNGTAIGWDAGQQRYLGNVTIAAGATVTVDVTYATTTYTATGTQFTAAPTVSAPTAGATWQAVNANTISWSGGSPTAGASYVVGVMDSLGDFVYPASGGHGGPSELPTSTTSATVPAATLAAGSDQVLVGIGTAGIANQTSGGTAFSSAASGSGMWLGFIAPLVSVTVQ